MSHATRPDPDPAPAVHRTRHPFDWGASADLEDTTARRVAILGPRICRGCWFLNPRYTVSAPAPTAEFFRAALQARSTWLRTCREAMGTSGHRRGAREARREGQRGGFLGLQSPPVAGAPTQPPPESIPWATLSRAERREVIGGGQLTRQLAYSGVMFIDGELVSPRTWQATADRLLGHDADARVTVGRRRFDLAALGAGDPAPLMSLSRSAIREHLARHPAGVAYINPKVTVSAPSPTHAFYEEVRKWQGQWCTLLKRSLGCGNVRRARRASDAAAITLVYSGVLVIGPEAYLPGCWPIHRPGPRRLKRTPFGTPTVPLSYLGLELPSAAG